MQWSTAPKFVPTVFAARQFVNHGHVQGERAPASNIPSFQVKVGDLVEIKDCFARDGIMVLEAQATSPNATCRTSTRSTRTAR